MIGYSKDKSRFSLCKNCYIDLGSHDIIVTDENSITKRDHLKEARWDVLLFLMEKQSIGSTADEISKHCYISESSVADQVSRIRKKHLALKLWLPDADGGLYKFEAPSIDRVRAFGFDVSEFEEFYANQIEKNTDSSSADNSKPFIFISYQHPNPNHSNIDVLESLCSTIPAADFFGLTDSPVKLEEYYVPPTFTRGGEKDFDLQDVIDSIFASENSNQLTFIAGESGSGKSTAVNAIVLSYVQNKKQKGSQEWTGISTPIPEDTLVFDINISDISNCYSPNNFFEYVKKAIEVTDIEKKTSMQGSPKAQPFFEYIKKCCEDESKTVVFIVRSPECFESVHPHPSHTVRIAFLEGLVKLLQEHSNIKVFCSTTNTVIEQLTRTFSIRLPGFIRFDICSPTEETLNLYVEKWVALNYSEDARKSKIKDLLTVIKNNSTVHQFVMSGPQAITMFLAAVKLDSQNSKYGSQTHYLKILSKAATTSVLEKTNFDEYDFIVPLSLLAVNCCMRSDLNFDSNDIRRVFGKANSDFQNMTSFITTKPFDEEHDSESLDAYVDEYISALSLFPFVDVRSRQYTFSPIWRNYYAANAIACGLIGDPKVSYVERFSAFVDNQMRNLRDDSHKDDTIATMWISVIAMASKLSKQNAENVVRVLQKYSADFSPSARRCREISVVTMLHILRNRCFVTDVMRHQITHNSLSYYLYHKQLDDINAIVATSPYREDVVIHMFNDFSKSIRDCYPIPLFHFAIGYLTFRYVDLSKWGKILDDPSKRDKVTESVCREILANATDGGDFYDRNINEAITVFESSFSKWSLERQIIFSLALNDMTWLTFANKIKIGEYQPPMQNCEFDIDRINKYAEILISLIQNEAFQISNAALYALSHIVAAERWNNLNCHAVNLLSSNLEHILLSDYNARIVYDDMVCQTSHETELDSSELQPYCGALRTMVLLEPTIEQIKSCAESLNKRIKGIGIYYRSVWDRYCSEYQCDDTVENAEKIRDNAKRYLMLMFRPCLLAGAFESYQEKLDAINLLWSLKFEKTPDDFDSLPHSDRTIGLDYDHESEFYKYIYLLRGRIKEFENNKIKQSN